MKVNILGTEYEIVMKTHEEEPYFKKKSVDGFEDGHSKLITVLDLDKADAWADNTEASRRAAYKEILRHEIIHAYFDESGLQFSSNTFGGAWATNEEMVDWMAIQFPKIMKTFQDADCL